MGQISGLWKKLGTLGIALLCLGYFAAYIPYTMLTKMLTDGLYSGMGGKGFNGFIIQPVVVLGSTAAMFSFITFARWWKYATHSKILGISVPHPQWFTFISGVLTAGQIITTTLAYTFQGISIVFMMLLMRGGVLILAPMVDIFARRRRRKIYWPSWMACALSVGALLVAFAEKASARLTIVAAVDVALYLFVYFFRLFIMSNRAKSDDAEELKRYFVEEKMVDGPFLLLSLFVAGLFGIGLDPQSILHQFWQGFISFPFQGYFVAAFAIGIFSTGTGLFGTLIFLDKRENTFTVPANRVSSILAGIVSSYLLAFSFGKRFPSAYELSGAALIIVAILFLMYRTVMDKRKQKAFASPPIQTNAGDLGQANMKVALETK